MPILRKIKRKENGVEETVHLGALAQNITQDATHRFVTDTEKQAWNSKPGSTSGLDNNVVTFTEAATRENLQSGEKLSISFGKIKKWFSDLGAAAFMAVANNCTTTAAGSALDARQGKVLMDKANQLSSELKVIGIVNDAITGTASIGSNELTNICNTWLEKGIYYINTHIRATLTNECNFDQYILVDDHQDARGSNSNVFGAGFNDNNIGFILEISATSSNVVLQVRHYSGERLSVDGWMFVTRIK